MQESRGKTKCSKPHITRFSQKNIVSKISHGDRIIIKKMAGNITSPSIDPIKLFRKAENGLNKYVELNLPQPVAFSQILFYNRFLFRHLLFEYL